MPTIKFRDIKNANENKMTALRFYENKYFGLFLNAYKFTNLSKSQSRYLLKRMWKQGTVACFIVEGTREDPTLKQALTNSSPNTVSISQDNPDGLLVFVPYAVNQWNIEDEPTVITLVNTRGATFIPQKPQIVNKDCVIGWAHTSHASVCSLVMYYIEKIVDVEKTIDTNLFVHKLPRLIVCSPEDKARVDDIMEAIENGEHKIFLDATDFQAIKNVLESGQGSYIIDKLYAYKQSLENELLTFLGINNVALEKKERLITDEANSNNQLINDSSDCFLDSLKAFCEEISDVLGYTISVEANSSPASNPEMEDEEDSQEEEEENA